MNFKEILACLEDSTRRNEYIARLKSAGPNSHPMFHLKNSMQQFTNVLACLEDSEKVNEYISRLKCAGPNSQQVLDLKNSMEGVNMNKSPKNIFETTMLQNTFKFCDPLECFLQFRLVCKPWKNAVETIKFDRFNDPNIFKNHTNYPVFLKKYLQTFKKLRIFQSQGWTFNSEWIRYGSTILESMQKLNEVSIIKHNKFTIEQQYFIEEILKNNNKTLKRIYLSKIIFPNVSFPRLTEIEFSIGEDISAQEFEANFPQLVKNMENVTVALLNITDENTGIYQYIGENYPKHCIEGTFSDSGMMLDYFPLKIISDLCDLNAIKNKNYINEVQYLQLTSDQEDKHPYNLSEDEWNTYQEIFNQCSKLKKIAFYCERENEEFDYEKIEFANLPENKQIIWEQRIQYFKKRGIQIVDRDDISYSEELQLKLAQENGIKWIFSFN